MNFVAFALVLAALILGAVAALVALSELAFRRCTGAALVLVTAGILLDLCTTWSHTVHT